MNDVNKVFFEPEPTGIEAGIDVQKLRKEFKGLTGGRVLAVDSISFKVNSTYMYFNSIILV